MPCTLHVLSELPTRTLWVPLCFSGEPHPLLAWPLLPALPLLRKLFPYFSFPWTLPGPSLQECSSPLPFLLHPGTEATFLPSRAAGCNDTAFSLSLLYHCLHPRWPESPVQTGPQLCLHPDSDGVDGLGAGKCSERSLIS